MRILFINRMEPFTPGGARRVIWELGCEMAIRGWDVHFFYSSSIINSPKVSGITFHRVPSSKGYWPTTHSFLLKSPFFFNRVLKAVQPDIVYDNTNPSPFVPAYFITKGRLVVRIHHVARRDAFLVKSGIINPIATFIMEEFFRLANGKHLIVDSQSTLNRVIKLIKRPKSLHIINPGVSKLKRKIEETSKRLDSVFCICRMAKSKGIKYLLQGWQIVEKKNQKAKLIIAGEGPNESKYRIMAKTLGLKRCLILGYIEEERKEQLLRECSIYVLPTLIEGLPISLLEAMKFGLAIVTTDTWGTRDLVENGKNGIIVPPKNYRALAEAILYLMANRDEIKRISEENLKCIPNYYSEKVIDIEIEILKGFLKS